MRFFVLTIVLISCYVTVNADPVTFLGESYALHYPNGIEDPATILQTPLTQHPDIVAQQIFGPGNPNGFVTFETFLQGPAGTLFRTEWIFDGQLLDIDDFILPFDFGPDFALVYGHEFPLSYTPKPVILNLSFGGQTATYTFTVSEPIPEAPTIELFALGTIAVGYYIRRRTKYR